MKRDTDLEALLDRGYRYALALCHDESAAEDLLHDAWLSVLRAGGAPKPGYLMRAIRSRFIDKHRRERLVIMTPLPAEPHTKVVPSQVVPGPDDELLGDALGKLRAEEREAIYLSAVEGMTGEEIAAKTGRTAGAVRTLLHRVRTKLRKMIERRRAWKETA